MPSVALTYQKSVENASEVLLTFFLEKKAPKQACVPTAASARLSAVLCLCFSYLPVSAFQSADGVVSLKNFPPPLPSNNHYFLLVAFHLRFEFLSF